MSSTAGKPTAKPACKRPAKRKSGGRAPGRAFTGKSLTPPICKSRCTCAPFKEILHAVKGMLLI